MSKCLKNLDTQSVRFGFRKYLCFVRSCSCLSCLYHSDFYLENYFVIVYYCLSVDGKPFLEESQCHPKRYNLPLNHLLCFVHLTGCLNIDHASSTYPSNIKLGSMAQAPVYSTSSSSTSCTPTHS